MCRSEGNKAVDIKKKKKERNIRDAGLNPGSRRPPWNKKWQRTPVFLPGDSYGQRSPEDYIP